MKALADVAVLDHPSPADFAAQAERDEMEWLDDVADAFSDGSDTAPFKRVALDECKPGGCE